MAEPHEYESFTAWFKSPDVQRDLREIEHCLGCGTATAFLVFLQMLPLEVNYTREDEDGPEEDWKRG